MVESYFAQAYLSLEARITSQAPKIKWVDFDLEQLEHYEDRPPVVFPCALIDFISTEYDEEGQLVQWGKPIIQVRLGFAPFSSANSAAPLPAKETAMQHFEIENDLFKALHGWEMTYNDESISQPLIRMRAATEQRNDKLRVRVMQFGTAFEDTGAMPVSQKVQARMSFRR